MNGIAELVKRTRLFKELPSEIIEKEIVPHGILKEFKKGEYIISAREKVGSFGVMVSGRVNIIHLFSDGGFSLIDAVEPEQILGLDLVCTRTRISPYHAAAAENSVLFFLPADVILKAGTLRESERQTVINSALLTIANLNMQKEYRLAILSQNGLRERIMTYLTMQAAQKQTATFNIPFSREEMASFLCVNRSALSHELAIMRNEGLIDFTKNRFTLYDDFENIF